MEIAEEGFHPAREHLWTSEGKLALDTAASDSWAFDLDKPCYFGHYEGNSFPGAPRLVPPHMEVDLKRQSRSWHMEWVLAHNGSPDSRY